MKKYAKLWNGIKYLIKTINTCQAGEYEKDYMKTRFNSHVHLALNKILKLDMLTVIVISVFQEGVKHYSVFLDECLYEL